MAFKCHDICGICDMQAMLFKETQCVNRHISPCRPVQTTSRQCYRKHYQTGLLLHNVTWQMSWPSSDTVLSLYRIVESDKISRRNFLMKCQWSFIWSFIELWGRRNYITVWSHQKSPGLVFCQFMQPVIHLRGLRLDSCLSQLEFHTKQQQCTQHLIYCVAYDPTRDHASCTRDTLADLRRDLRRCRRDQAATKQLHRILFPTHVLFRPFV